MKNNRYMILEPRPRKAKKEYQIGYDAWMHFSSSAYASQHASLFRRFFRMFSLVFLVFLLHGCFDYHEVESVTIVSGIGVMMEGDEMLVHLELIEKGRIPSEGEGIKTILTKGKTFGDAMRNIVLQSGKRPYFGHTQVLIVDEAALGLLPNIVDDLLSQKEVRLDLQIVGAREAVPALFESKEELRAFDLFELLKMNRYAATSMSLRLLDFMEQENRSYLLPLITIQEEQPTLQEGALLMVHNEEKREVNASFIQAYLILDDLFESSVTVIDADDAKPILSELNQVKAKFERSGERASIDIRGTLLITHEDKDDVVKNYIEQDILTKVEQFLVENETIQLIDLNEKLGSRKLFEMPDQTLPQTIDVAVTIDVQNASNVRRGR